jgi:hypothetical protein
MGRKLNIPKDKQIAGLRKAIANRKTPRQFIPSMKKRLAKLTGAGILLLTSILYPRISSYAQAPVSIVPIAQTLAAAGTACAGTTQTFPVNNRNQTQHNATLVLSGTTTSASLQIQAADSSGNTFIISPTVQAGVIFGGISAITNASGYYPTVNILVTCAVGGTFTLTYSGSQATPVTQGGAEFLSLVDQQIFTGVSGASNQNGPVFQTPFGNSSGILVFKYASSAVSGSSLTVLCVNTATSTTVQFAFTIANTTAVQTFKVPPTTCAQAQLLYTSGGAAGNISDEYIFDSPGDAVNTTLGNYTHITGTTATAVKGTAGTFLGIDLNTSGAGTISVFDLASASCTGTPSTNTVAVLTIAATENARAIPFNVSMLNGVCVKASAAMDFTVSSQ